MAGLGSILMCGLALCFFSPITCDTKPTIDAPAGVFQGFVDRDPKGQSFVAFRGIPYAKPPVGELRFSKPLPLERIEGTFNATEWGPHCPVPDPFAFMMGGQGQEDCLNLNVFTKEMTPGALKKVMVFIHGGGYIFGSAVGAVPGVFVNSHDMVFVTINYRIGVLGFLSTGDQSSPGNYGLWDMTLALQWVKDNIASFGGDPSDVTISGESAGGSAVGYLSISPHTNGLFSKAYPQSGGPTSAFGKVMTPQKHTLTLAKSLNCYDGDATDGADVEMTQKVTDCLRKLPMSNFSSYMGFLVNDVPFAPTVDGDFIPRPPLHLLKDDDYLTRIGFFQRSYLVGIDNNENVIYKNHVDGTKMMMRQQEGMTDEEKESTIDGLVTSAYSNFARSRLDTEVPKPVVDKIVDWYDRRFGNDSLGHLLGDLGFMVPTLDFIEAAARGTKVWLLHFNHYPRYMKGQPRGMVHGLDLVYYFDITLETIEKLLNVGIDHETGFGAQDDRLRGLFQSIIAGFSQTGAVPKDIGGVAWPEYSNKLQDYLDLKPRVEVRQGLGMEQRRLWMEDVPKWMEDQQQSHQHTEL